MSASRFRLTKTTVWHALDLPLPGCLFCSSMWPMRFARASTRDSWLECICTCCVIERLATSSSSPPTLMRIALQRKSLDNARTSRGQVAENIIVWRTRSSSSPAASAGGGMSSTTARSCGSKPMSSMRSASSRTRKRTPLILRVWSRIRSVSRPGVPTTRSSLPPSWNMARSCSCLRCPPKTHTVLQPKASASGRASSWICCASSRVGASTTPTGPRSLRSVLLRVAASHSSGIKKPIVLPEPVWATPTTSRPASEMGSDCAWIGVGCV
mmetsp:Transcript_49705/g.106210  ORF Transcript_49705/g.106210 Transcript_49705/m.106210 type:complete len:269 (+) Transcript_49705:405-1211(+)